MQPSKSNPVVRVLAVLALAAAFLLVIVIVATTGGGSGEGDRQKKTTPVSARVERALKRGVYVVEPGDTLIGISEKTGIEVDELQQLNPKLDPQTLNSGERIKLR